MYQPNFCADCGERISRARWHLWTSRRFCQECAPRFLRTRIWPPLLAGLALFGFGLSLGRFSRPEPPPLIVERSPSSSRPTQPTQTARSQPERPGAKAESANAPQNPAPRQDASALQWPAETSEVISICGALTKKGTPCQRRVHGTGRCWQHKDQPAVIPLQNRIIKGG